MISDRPPFTGAKRSHGFVLLKGLAALGFMTAANLVILYAC